MRDEHNDDLKALGDELQPTPEQVAALIDGSLSAHREPPETLGLLRELPSPSTGDVRALKASVVHALDHPPRRRVWPWVGALALAAAVVAGAAWWLL